MIVYLQLRSYMRNPHVLQRSVLEKRNPACICFGSRVVISFSLTTPPPFQTNPPCCPPQRACKSPNSSRFGLFRSPIRSVSGGFWRALGCWVGSGWGRGEGGSVRDKNITMLGITYPLLVLDFSRPQPSGIQCQKRRLVHSRRPSQSSMWRERASLHLVVVIFTVEPPRATLPLLPGNSFCITTRADAKPSTGRAFPEIITSTGAKFWWNFSLSALYW